MKTTKRFLSVLVAVVLLLTSFSVIGFAVNLGESYYIDAVNGNDANSGLSEEDAVKTIGGLKLGNITAGTKFLFKNGGKYECTATLGSVSGTKDNPIVISSYGEGEKAVLYTNAATEVLTLIDCSYVTVCDIDITAPNGGGIWINTATKPSVGITIDNVYFYDMPNGKVTSRDDFSLGAARARAAVMVKSLPGTSRYPVNDLTITNCEVYDVANGFIIWGSWNESETPWCENESEIDPVFNTGLLIKDCYLHDMDAEAMVIGMCDGALVTNCRAIDCCQGEGVDENGEILYFTAAMWFWGSVNSTIQYCEIAGQKNFGDGMAVDFDSYTHNCTYQYIYSHDNMRFVCNNPNYSGHHGNTVRYCLSVNDNGGRSTMAVGSCGEHEFNFYNNTIINSAEFHFKNMYNSYVANNIFVMQDGCTIAYDLDNALRGNVFENNCYYNVMSPVIDLGSLNVNPGFAGDNTSDIKNYELSADSPLVGGGAKIDDGLTTDFFGNEITSSNIGCYSGDGVEAEYPEETSNEFLFRILKNIIQTLIHEIMGLFD
ncbi:MAG: hypothetical protein J6D06_01915 [Clostridia bacterium]|nr:hypothetical protein [Clostridia bacterium]